MTNSLTDKLNRQRSDVVWRRAVQIRTPVILVTDHTENDSSAIPNKGIRELRNHQHGIRQTCQEMKLPKQDLPEQDLPDRNSRKPHNLTAPAVTTEPSVVPGHLPVYNRSLRDPCIPITSSCTRQLYTQSQSWTNQPTQSQPCPHTSPHREVHVWCTCVEST